MHATTTTSSQPAVATSFALTRGLAGKEVRRRLRAGLAVCDAGHRILAFYLVEMDERRLYNETGHANAAHFARLQLGLNRRRAAELIRVGRVLQELPAIDAALCAHELCWSKVVLLARVVVPRHEAAWLERALGTSCAELASEIAKARPGDAPRRAGEGKGLNQVKIAFNVLLDRLSHERLQALREQLSAERGIAITDEELLDILVDNLANTEEDGSLPGRTRVSASQYQVVVHLDSDGKASVDTDDGRLPIENAEAICCDAGRVPGARDRKTPPAMRRRVITRDGNRCRCCGSRRQLMVHHIKYLSQGGLTRPWNLITLCSGCHGRVHADLLVIEGVRAIDARFVSRDGTPIEAVTSAVRPSDALVSLTPPPAARAAPAADPAVTLDTVPEVINAEWWRAHSHLLTCRGDGGLVLRAGRPRAVPAPQPRADADAARAADPLGNLIGQGPTIARLRDAVRGSVIRGVRPPHLLLGGAPGTGKTTLARGYAALGDRHLVEVMGPMLKQSHDLVRVLASLPPDAMLFIDEIHAVPLAVTELLYQAMVDQELTLSLHADARARSVRLILPRFTLVAATTDEGGLSSALRSRFGLREFLTTYATDELAELARRAARAAEVELSPAAAQVIAEAARGTPRELLRLTERMLEAAARTGTSVLDQGAARAALQRLGFDRDGLTPAEQVYLRALRGFDRPVSLQRLAHTLGVSPRTLSAAVEPHLFRAGLVEMTARGRVATSPSARRAPPHVRRAHDRLRVLRTGRGGVEA